LLYVFALLVPLSGLALSASFGLAPIVFGGGTLPADLNAGLHGLLDPLLALLILLHIGAALYHQFILRDNLLARMWYGK
jgi:cytochrome b561